MDMSYTIPDEPRRLITEADIEALEAAVGDEDAFDRACRDIVTIEMLDAVAGAGWGRHDFTEVAAQWLTIKQVKEWFAKQPKLNTILDYFAHMNSKEIFILPSIGEARTFAESMRAQFGHLLDEMVKVEQRINRVFITYTAS